MSNNAIVISTEKAKKLKDILVACRKECELMGMSNVYKVREVLEKLIDILLDALTQDQSVPVTQAPMSLEGAIALLRSQGLTVAVPGAPAPSAAPAAPAGQRPAVLPYDPARDGPLTPEKALAMLQSVGMQAEITPPTGRGGPPAPGPG